MSWKQQKMISLAAIAAALLVNCLPIDAAHSKAENKVAVAP